MYIRRYYSVYTRFSVNFSPWKYANNGTTTCYCTCIKNFFVTSIKLKITFADYSPIY